MTFKLLLYAPDWPKSPGHPEENICKWPEVLRKEITGIDVRVATSFGEAIKEIADADAAFGNIDTEIFGYARNLKWLACPLAGPPHGWYHEALIKSDVVVTNARDIFNDHISSHILAFVLAFARGLNNNLPHQIGKEWRRPVYPVVHLPDSTILIVGVGGIGGETARLCKAFGLTVVATDPRVKSKPDGVDELYSPDGIDALIPRADFVVSTVPETPATQGYFNANFFSRMKNRSFFINIGRGATVVLKDLNRALVSGHLAGAALDVFQTEPLPSDDPLWGAPGVMITPHVAGEGPYLANRRTELLVENCKRFARGDRLINVVDKDNWF